MSPPSTPTPADDPALREALKRCSPATYYAACKFRATGDVEALRTALLGIVERFVERDLRPKLQAPPATLHSLHLCQDLGLDSLTLMEVVMLAEEVVPITISNEELTRLTTLGQVHAFIESKLTAPRAVEHGPALPASMEEWNVAAAGDAMRPLDAPIETAIDALPRPQARHA